MRYFSAFVLCFTLASASAQERPQLQWLGLFHWDLAAWLDNVHQLDQLCPATMDAADKVLCLIEKRKPKTLELPVREAPKADAAQLGTLVITATPGEGLSYVFKDADGGNTEFTPDVYDKEWGYGPWAHQTLLERQDNWFKLPAEPFPQAAWLEGDALGPKIPLETVETGSVYVLDKESVVFLEFGADSVTLRAEQMDDMPCGEVLSPEPAEPRQVPYADLFGEDGHLKVQPKYTRGC